MAAVGTAMRPDAGPSTCEQAVEESEVLPSRKVDLAFLPLNHFGRAPSLLSAVTPGSSFVALHRSIAGLHTTGSHQRNFETRLLNSNQVPGTCFGSDAVFLRISDRSRSSNHDRCSVNDAAMPPRTNTQRTRSEIGFEALTSSITDVLSSKLSRSCLNSRARRGFIRVQLGIGKRTMSLYICGGFR